MRELPLILSRTAQIGCDVVQVSDSELNGRGIRLIGWEKDHGLRQSDLPLPVSEPRRSPRSLIREVYPGRGVRDLAARRHRPDEFAEN